MTQAFECTGLIKRYPEFQLGPLDIGLEPGTVLGYVGPNGSGKSTTLHCLVGLVKADNGSIEVFGRRNDPMKPEWKLDIGYVGDEQVFYEGWTGARNLKFLSQFYPDWSDAVAGNLVKRFDLSLDKPAKALSRGNRVKLALVAALAHSPRLLLFDEPTSGLDPVVRDELLDVLFETMESGERAIFYSTHILSDIARLADEIAFLQEGSLIMRAPKDDLTDRWRRITFRLHIDIHEIDSAVNHTCQADDHVVVSIDGETTMRHLHSLGAERVQENRMSIDEIAVQILRSSKERS